ncbi:ATP-dependent DNA helicase RecG [Peptostreptococcaceae bacterium pGA-8]|nr:ATP-dependent DNA helicase RecG [Peptostreptococcaceae bacterium pGA-8]
MSLKDDISAIKGIGPKKALVLHNVGINKVQDLLNIIPVGYQDKRVVSKVFFAKAEDTVLIECKVISKHYYGSFRTKNSPLIIYGQDDTGIMEILFFNGMYVNNMIKEGQSYSFFGVVKDNKGKKQLIHPEFHALGSHEDRRGIVPIYKSIGAISGKEIGKWISGLEDDLEDSLEWLPEKVIEENNLCTINLAYKWIHFPTDAKLVLQGKYRLIFDELMVLETGLFYMRNRSNSGGKGKIVDCSFMDSYISTLPFSLTSGQKTALRAIKKDLSSSRPMNRLVQGDVGSGKTVVAQCAMICCGKSKMQSVMMVPTEILAKQHFMTISQDFEKHGIRTALLVGGTKAREKREIKEALAKGDIDVLIGTHAVISEDVEFKNLGLVITDEQHRFGVKQRAALAGKGADTNVMVMTATPIPRTLAVIIYGDLDISVIKTMPKGRKKIKTEVGRNEIDRIEIYEKIEAELEKGRQAYVIAPLIEESEAIDAKSADEIFSELKSKFSRFNVEILHGELKQEQKDAIMSAFMNKEIDLLVSTVVIEVGVNVPNATIMVIENCERFGLAQMHQLRGRVGRGEEQSYCYLLIGNESEKSVERAEILSSSADGFEIAEADLRLRGPGDIFGLKQHGLPDLHIADLVRHGDVLERARESAKELLENDSNLSKNENKPVREKVVEVFGENISLNM